MNRTAASLVGNLQAIVESLKALLEVPGGTKKKKQPAMVKMPAELVQAAAYALILKGQSHLLVPELWHPARTNGVLVLSQSWVEKAIAALQTPQKNYGEPRPARICAAELLYSFITASGRRHLEIPVMVFTEETLTPMKSFQDGEVAAIIVKAVKSNPVGCVTLTRQQVYTVVDFLDPDGASKRTDERQAAAATVADELHRRTRKRRGWRIHIPPELIRLVLLYLPEGEHTWLEQRLKRPDRRGQVRITRWQIYDLCDVLDPAGTRRRQQASRAARRQRKPDRRCGNGRKKTRRERRGKRPKEKGTLLQPSKRAARADEVWKQAAD